MEDVLETLRAAAESTRLRLLAICKYGEFSVTELVQIVGQSQPRVSRHLKLLCEAGLLERFREQNYVFYRLASEGFGAQLSHFLLKNLPLQSQSLVLDAQRAEKVLDERHKEADQILARLEEQKNVLAKILPRETALNRALLATVKDLHLGDLLDIGTGTGRILKLLAKNTSQAVGIDISPEMLRVARSKIQKAGLSNVSIRQGDMYHLGFPNASFDTVTIDQVLSFSDNPQAVVQEVSRLLKAGGHLLLLDIEFQDCSTLEALDAQSINRKELREWCAECGLIPQKQLSVAGQECDAVVFLFKKIQGGTD